MARKLNPNVKGARAVQAAAAAYLRHADGPNGNPDSKRAKNALAKLADLCKGEGPNFHRAAGE